MTTRIEDLIIQEEIWKMEEDLIEDFDNELLSKEEYEEKLNEIYIEEKRLRQNQRRRELYQRRKENGNI